MASRFFPHTPVREGHVTDALVVNINGEPVRIKHGLLLGKCLAYNLNVVPVPLEFPTAYVSSVHKSSVDTDLGQAPTLCSVVTVVDYPEMKHSLLELLERFRDVIALPGESLGETDRTAHHIRLKPGSQPVYVAPYRLPHSQKASVDEMIQDISDQGVIQNTRSPWNSPLFLVPKKDKSFRPVIDFRRVSDDHYTVLILNDLLMSSEH